MGTNEQLLVDGVPVVAYTFNRQERPTADDTRALAGHDRAVAALLDQRAGWWVTSADEELVDALLAAGASVVRHSHLYSRPLTPTDAPAPPLPPGLRWTPIDRTVDELTPLVVAAYPPGHVDHLGPDPALEEAELVALLTGELVGPCRTDASGLVVDGDRPAALVIINRSAGTPPAGGPWVSQVCRLPDPAYAGLGALALGHAIAALAAAGDTTLGLAVTDDNPARGVYERLGFRHVASRRKLALPSGGSKLGD